jgi:hypothetical protein
MALVRVGARAAGFFVAREETEDKDEKWGLMIFLT